MGKTPEPPNGRYSLEGPKPQGVLVRIIKKILKPKGSK